MNAHLNEPMCQQVAWKCGAVIAFAVHLVRVGLDTPHFGTDDVPDHLQPDGSGIAGSTVEMLRNAHVIRNWYGSDAEQGVVAGRRRSRRKEANGRKVDVYELCSRGAAVEFLRRHGAAVDERGGWLFDMGGLGEGNETHHAEADSGRPIA